MWRVTRPKKGGSLSKTECFSNPRDPSMMRFTAGRTLLDSKENNL